MTHMAVDTLFCQFTRARVERGDLSHFLSIAAPDKLPTGGRLHEMIGRLTFIIQGYEPDPREAHGIPEIRRFYTRFFEAWPYWFYFCNLDTEALCMMVLCCLPSVRTLKVDGRSKVSVGYSKLGLLRFMANGIEPMYAMYNRAEMSARQDYDLTKAVFEYFEVPFDAEPPP